MKISYEWLKDYVDIEKSPEQLSEDLSLFGHEVESLEKINGDFVLDFEITPNRGDCLSILGMAREIAALYNVKIKNQKSKIKVEESKLDQKINIEIFDPKICPRFTARIIDNVKIGESPEWMQKKLASYGFRPVNNIVDVTNYVMVATGQPLHAFDYDKIKDGLMKVRLSKKGEEVMTLDGKNHILPDDAIIIEDNEKIYDLAGIMGGFKSEVDENTKTILLQGAIFDPVLIRRASKYLHHTTDASYRYERGVDFEGTITGVDTAASLISEICSDAKVGERIDIISNKFQPRKINFVIAKVNDLLGTEITIDDAEDYLTRLGFKIDYDKSQGQADSSALVPSYRNYDIKLWQDLAEEIARVYGYNKIQKNQISKTKNQKENPEFTLREIIKDVFVEKGFTEAYSYSFAKKEEIEKLGTKIQDCAEIANPLSAETQYLRPSLLPSLLSSIAKNPWAPEIKIFEIGKAFTQNSEKWQLGIASVGKSDKEIQEVVEKIKEILNINFEIKIDRAEQPILDFYKIRRPVVYSLIELSDLADKVGEINQNYNTKIENKKFKPLSKFPPTVRDVAFIVNKEISADNVAQSINENDEKILFVELFDEFESEKFGQNKKNLAYHIWLQDIKGPISESDSENIIKKIVSNIEDKFDAKLRTF